MEVDLLLSTQARLLSGGRLLSLALLGGITLTPMGVPAESVHAAAQPAQTWLTLAGPWLCRDWAQDSNGSTARLAFDGAIEQTRHTADTLGYVSGDATVHCTRLWHVDASGKLISDAPSWVPNPSGAWPSGPADYLPDGYLLHVDTPVATPKPKLKQRKIVHKSVSTSSVQTYHPAWTPPPQPSGGYNPWAPVPGHPTYGMSDYAGDPGSFEFGVCTWWAWFRHQNEPLLTFGSAGNWPAAARAHGLRVGYTPAVGATAVFMGVEGAASGGHVGHVEAVLGGGWFIISEMNFYWNGGGWARVDWRYVYVTSGVSFIY
ncbi:MAG: CHAP domain-containing protein [Ktedonobacterales bacterium]